MGKSKYEIGDKVIFNSQIFIVTDVGCVSQTYWYFIKAYNKQNHECRVITDKFLKPYNNI